MTQKRYAAKRDVNEREIIEALRAVGCSVQQLDGKGVPDLLVHSPVLGLILMEVKAGRGRLTDAQKQWHREWGGCVYVVRSVDEAIRIARGER